MPSKSRNGNSASSKVTVEYTSITYSGKTGKITSPKLKFYSTSGWSDSTNRGRVRGGAVADDTLFTNVTLNGGTKTWSASATTVQLSFLDTTTVNFIGEVAGVSFYENDNNSDWYGPNLSITMNRLNYGAPSAPTNLDLRRVSDTEQRFTFGGQQTNNEEFGYTQYVDWEVQVNSTAAAWERKGTSVNPSSAYYSLATSAGNRYRVRVRFTNRDGVSAWATSGWIGTTPAAPAPSAAISGSNIVITCSSASGPYRTDWQIQQKQNEAGSFGSLNGNALIDTAQTTYTHVSPSTAIAWRYQCRNVIEGVPVYGGGTTTLYSAWAQTGLIVAIPEVQTGLTVRRKTAGDGTTSLAWSRAASASGALRKYASQQVQVQLNSDAAPATLIPSQPGVSATTAEHPTAENSRYRYRVQAVNARGSSGWSAWSGWIATKPAAPTLPSPALTKVTPTVLRSKWNNVAPYRTGTKLGWSENGGAEFDPSLSAGAAATSIDRTIDPGATHRFRAYHIIAGVPLLAGGTVTLVSNGTGWSETVQTQAPPTMPLLASSAAVIAAALDPLTVSVKHRPVDGSAMTDVKVEYRIGAGAWTTLTPASSPPVTILSDIDAAVVFDAGTLSYPDLYEFRAATKGADPGWSPDGTSIFVQAAPAPTASVDSPYDGEVVEISTLTVAVTGLDMQLWDARLLDVDGAVIWSRTSLPGTTFDAPYLVAGVVLIDDETYTFSVNGTSSYGLRTGWISSTFSVQYLLPPKAELLEAEWLPDWGRVEIQVQVPDPGGGEVAAVTCDLQRLTDGKWVTVEANVAILNSEVAILLQDPIPPLGVVSYRVLTRSDLPSIMPGDVVPVRVWSDGWVYVNGGDDFRQVARLRGDKDLQRSVVDDSVQIVPDGRSKPIELYGNVSYETFSIAGRVAKHVWQEQALGTQKEWLDLAKVKGTKCYRNHRNVRAFGSMSGVSVNEVSGAVAANFTELDYVE